MIIILCAALFSSVGWAAYSEEEGDLITVTKDVSSTDTLTFSGDEEKFRAYFIKGCPNIGADADSTTCSWNGIPDSLTLTFNSSSKAEIGIVSIDDDCVSGGAMKRSSLTLTWVIDDVTTTDTYHFSDDDERSALWLSLFPDDTNAC